MNAAVTLISRLRRADPDGIRKRLAEIAAEEKALRELLRLIRLSKMERGHSAKSAAMPENNE